MTEFVPKDPAASIKHLTPEGRRKRVKHRTIDPGLQAERAEKEENFLPLSSKNTVLPDSEREKEKEEYWWEKD